MIVHLLEFRVVPGHDGEFAAYLRALPHATEPTPDLPALCAGHRIRNHRSEYVLISVWVDHHLYEREIDASGLPRYLQSKAHLISGRASSAFEVTVAHWGPGMPAPQVLRIYRGAVDPSALDQWHGKAEESARTLAPTSGLSGLLVGKVLAGAGTPAGEAGARPESAAVPVMALSCWLDWASVLEATGGHIDRLVLDTELAGLEKPSGVDHYQLVDLDPTSD